MNGRRTLALALVAMSLACDGSSNGKDQPCERDDAVRLGAIISLTGGLSSFGPTIDLSVELAADEINRQGGVLGRPLCIHHADDATDPAKAKTKAEEMVADQRISGILGGLSSGSSVEILDVTRARGMMQISCCSTSPALTGQDNFYRTAPSDALQARVLARKAVQQNYMTVGVIYLTGPYGEGLKSEFELNYAKDGRSIAAAVAYTEKQSSYRTLVDQVVAASPEAILLIAYPEDGVTLVNEVKAARNMETKWLFTEGLRSTVFLANLGAAKPYVEGALGTAPAASENAADLARSQAFLAAFNAFADQNETTIPTFADTSYDTVYLAAAAIQRAASTDRALAAAKVIEVSKEGVSFGPGQWADGRAALEAGMDVDYQGASGTVDLDDVSGDPFNVSYEVWTVSQGQVERLDVQTP